MGNCKSSRAHQTYRPSARTLSRNRVVLEYDTFARGVGPRKSIHLYDNPPMRINLSVIESSHVDNILRGCDVGVKSIQ